MNSTSIKLTITLGAFFLIKVILLLYIGDKGWEPDSYQHFLEMRDVYSDFPNNLDIGISVWSKPLYTFPFAFLVHLFNTKDILVIQIANLVISIVISVLVFLTTLKIYNEKKLAYTALILSQLSFLLFKSSITGLTEPIFTLFLMAGFYAVVNKRIYIASLLFGIAILGRIEGLFFAGVFGLWLIYYTGFYKDVLSLFKKDVILNQFKAKFYKLAICAILIISPVLIWNTIGYLDSGRLFYIFDAGYPTEPGQYGYGSWLHFPKRLLVQETIIFISYLLSVGIFIKKFNSFKFKKELLYLVIVTSGFLFTQMWFWVIGQFGSAGLMRYLISITPFSIIFSMIFFDYIFKQSKKLQTQNTQIVIIAIVLLAQSILTFSHFVGVGPLDSKWITSEPEQKLAGEWIKNNVAEYELVNTTSPSIMYYAKRDNDVSKHSIFRFKGDIENKVPGYYIWDGWGIDVSGISLEYMYDNAELIENFNDVYIFKVK